MKTIGIGIDLGTTNSSVAVVRAGTTEIIKNANGEEATPSIVYAEKSGSILVGSKARRKIFEDPSQENSKNWKAEVKRLMGTNELVRFPNVSREFSPEEISAEILKSLLADVERRYPDVDRTAAVITVPAHFSTLQSEATKRAGQVAGFKQVVLLQEPIAAALAYGFTTNSDENWIVYDLGGGTFDVAVVAARGGSLSVLAHGGDNFLGGKDIDGIVVDHFIGPWLKQKHSTVDYVTNLEINKKLRAYAEQLKIDLSTSEAASIDISLDLSGKQISESYTLTREQLKEACHPLLQKTVNICLETIKQSHAEKSSIKRIVLVGGPTQMSILRSYLSEKLGIVVDGSQDPLTVVAKGAALFAQQIEATTSEVDVTKEKLTDASCKIELNYSPVTSDDQQTVTGKVLSGSHTAHSICIQSEDKAFNSGDFILKNGKFICSVPVGLKGGRYWIYLKDSSGGILGCHPDSFSISRGVSISGAPLPHSVGVSIVAVTASKGFADFEETMDIFFPRNSTLPLKATKRFYTVKDLSVSEDGNALPVRVYEGESPIPNRNTLICDLAITGKMVSRNLKKGSPVDITVSIDESRQLSVDAYIPEIDVKLNARATIHDEDVSVAELKSSLKEQEHRSDKVGAESDGRQQVGDLISEIEESISKGQADSDQKRKASKQIKELMTALDEIESKAAFDGNVTEFFTLAEEVGEYAAAAHPKANRAEYTSSHAALRQEGIRSVETKDAVVLKQVIEKMNRMYWGWMFNDPVILAGFVVNFQKNLASFEDQKAMEENIAKCGKALEENDTTTLRQLVSDMFAMPRVNGDATETRKQILKAGITR